MASRTPPTAPEQEKLRYRIFGGDPDFRGVHPTLAVAALALANFRGRPVLNAEEDFDADGKLKATKLAMSFATEEEAQAGTEEQKIISPATLAAVLAGLPSPSASVPWFLVVGTGTGILVVDTGSSTAVTIPFNSEAGATMLGGANVEQLNAEESNLSGGEGLTSLKRLFFSQVDNEDAVPFLFDAALLAQWASTLEELALTQCSWDGVGIDFSYAGTLSALASISLDGCCAAGGSLVLTLGNLPALTALVFNDPVSGQGG
jgi:hypothetical protein